MDGQGSGADGSGHPQRVCMAEQDGFPIARPLHLHAPHPYRRGHRIFPRRGGRAPAICAGGSSTGFSPPDGLPGSTFFCRSAPFFFLFRHVSRETFSFRRVCCGRPFGQLPRVTGLCPTGRTPAPKGVSATACCLSSPCTPHTRTRRGFRRRAHWLTVSLRYSGFAPAHSGTGGCSAFTGRPSMLCPGAPGSGSLTDTQPDQLSVSPRRTRGRVRCAAAFPMFTGFAPAPGDGCGAQRRFQCLQALPRRTRGRVGAPLLRVTR